MRREAYVASLMREGSSLMEDIEIMDEGLPWGDESLAWKRPVDRARSSSRIASWVICMDRKDHQRA